MVKVSLKDASEFPLVFSIDKVRKLEDGDEVDLGTFLEIRSSLPGGKDVVKKIQEELGLEDAPVRFESYFEM